MIGMDSKNKSLRQYGRHIVKIVAVVYGLLGVTSLVFGILVTKKIVLILHNWSAFIGVAFFVVFGITCIRSAYGVIRYYDNRKLNNLASLIGLSISIVLVLIIVDYYGLNKKQPVNPISMLVFVWPPIFGYVSYKLMQFLFRWTNKDDG